MNKSKIEWCDKMTKLICHHYEKDKGNFEAVEIKVKETAKRFSLSRASAEAMQARGEYWAVLPKDQLDELRANFGVYCMYSRQENMARFQELVIADLEKITITKKAAYDKSLESLGRARNGAK